MNGNRSIVYREFVGVTPVAKTLRNELRPVGHTQEHIIQNGLIQEDELRQEKSTYQHQNISESNGKTVSDAEKIKSDQSHNNGCPDKRTAFLFQEKSDDRDNDNVACSDKTCFSDSCVLDTELLEAAGSKEGGSAGDSARPQVAAVIWSGRRSFL